MKKQNKNRMTKVMAFLLTFSVLSLSGTAMVFSSFAKEEPLTYEGHQYDRATLSQETIDWLEAYNAMPENERGMINHVPYELRALQPESRAGVQVFESGSELGGASLRSLLPTSGGEAVYNPSYWNDPSNIMRANCYAYAMDVICGSEMRLQPGALAGAEYTQLTATNIIAAAKKDGPYLGNGRTLNNSSETATSTSKSYKVALVLDTSGYLQDYHWYTQNSNGYWSHKPGQTEATDLDASGNYITNPRTCNRNYGNDLNYATWGGYLMVTRR